MMFAAILVIWLAGATSLCLTLRCWRHQGDVSGTRWLTALMGGITIWSLAYAVELSLQSLDAMRWTTAAAYIGLATVPVCLLGFSVSLTGKARLLTPGRVILLFLIPAVVVTLVATNPRHLLYYADVRLGAYGAVFHQILTPGPFWWLHLVYSYLCVGIAFSCMTSLWFRVRGLDRARIGYMLAGILLPLVLNVLYSAGLRPANFLDLTPFGFMFMGTLLFHGMFRVGLFDVTPQALDLLFDRLPEALFILDRNRHVVNANPSGMRLLRNPDFVERFAEKAPGPRWAHRLRVSTTGGQEDVSLADQVWVMRTLPLQTKGKPLTGYLITLHDISERVHLQAQLAHAQKMESIGRLAGGIAHDFNNMLQAILGNAEMALIHDGLDASLRADIEGIRDVALRSGSLTRQLLAFARKAPATPQVLDLNETVSGMLNMLRRILGENIALIWIPGPDLWPVRMDPAQMDSILANLCVNSRDAISGTGTIRVETRNVTLDEDACSGRDDRQPGDYVLLHVQDNGCGMDADTLAHVFQPFFTTKQPGKGVGLGLASVYGTVGQNGGSLDLTSTPGKGTCFLIYLPRHSGPETDPPV